MLQFKPNPLSEVHQQQLRLLPASEGYQILKSVIAAKADESGLLASNKLIESGKYEKMEGTALEAAASARRYQSALEVLKEIEEMPNHYLTSLTL